MPHVKDEADWITFENFIGMRQVKVLGQQSCLRLWCKALTIKLSSDWLFISVYHKCLNNFLMSPFVRLKNAKLFFYLDWHE